MGFQVLPTNGSKLKSYLEGYKTFLYKEKWITLGIGISKKLFIYSNVLIYLGSPKKCQKKEKQVSQRYLERKILEMYSL